MPHRCPICEGKGKLKGFYPDAPADKWEDCRACHGRGVIQEINLGGSYPVPVPQPYPMPYPAPSPWRPSWYWTVTSGPTTYKPPIDVSYQVVS